MNNTSHCSNAIEWASSCGKEGVEAIALPQIEWYRQRWNEAVFNGYSLVDKSKGA